MAHHRKILRDQVKAALIAGVPSVSGEVEGMDAFNRNADALPALEVSTPVSSGAALNADGDFEARISLVIKVRLSSRASQDAEDEADDILEEVEAVIYALEQPYQILNYDYEFEIGDPAERVPAAAITTFEILVLATTDDPQTVS